ncbi:DUF2059 domain-containing protein [Luteimonas deserti]|uniref:DUF2059 domain-containing protein n=1 Tax=Luteimonas deserti TaxID=2752306 RepID=A0A7Z0QNH7_9GAMM|nr:DUF2059 domain-containing protein [Luteimonas deserti]NYZ61854.1 DUF2059 domain-containing protein [Luteimonas deserti]
MTRTFRLAALLALAFAAPAALAAPPSPARIDRLLEVMRAEQTVAAMMPQVLASQQQMVAQLTRDADPQQREAAMRAVTSSMRAVESALSWDALQPMYRDIYARTFTAEDTDAMIDFYSSPAGQNLLDKMPLLMQNTMTAVQGLVVPMLQQLERDLRSQLDTDAPAAAD